MSPSPEDEYAAAFRRGYERARRSAEPTVRLDDPRAPVVPPQRGTRPDSEPAPGAEPGPAREPFFPGATVDDEPDRRRRLLAAAALGLGAVVLVGGAFGVGRMFADGTQQGVGAGEQSDRAVTSDAVGEGARAPYDGPVASVDVATSEATCQAGDSADAAGNPISYGTANAHDSDLTTAWRCDGSGAGERLTVTLSEEMAVAEVGLVPGYAKTDPANGADRYAENNRITRVRWHFDDGTSYVQEFRADPADRSMRTMRVPRTATGRVVVELLASAPGPRNTVAISEIRIAAPTS